jgi:hypothetical protein
MTAIEIFAVEVPPVFVAEIVYAVDDCIAVGVPVITHAVDNEIPAGRVGDDVHDVTAPPVFVGVIVPTDVLIFQL